MCDQPKISVIMPAYNAEKYIGSMMDSLLAQTMPDFELIVVLSLIHISEPTRP